MELQGLKDIYDRYVEEVGKVYANATPVDGLFGWGDDPRKDPCHMRFYEAVESWVRDFHGAQQPREAVFEVVRFMIEAPAGYKQRSCFWFMYAAQGLCRDLVKELGREECAILWEFYDEHYPKRDRMPVQQELYKLLKKRTKATP